MLIWEDHWQNQWFLGNHCKFQWFWTDHCKFFNVFEETITIECFSAVWPLPSMVFQWFFILLPSLSMVFDGFRPLVKRCDGFDGSLWSIAFWSNLYFKSSKSGETNRGCGLCACSEAGEGFSLSRWPGHLPQVEHSVWRYWLKFQFLVLFVMFISNNSDGLYINLYLYLLYLHMGGRGYKDQMLPRIHHPSFLCKLHYANFVNTVTLQRSWLGWVRRKGRCYR